MKSDEMITRYWLLDLATEFPRSLGLLFPSIESEALNVKEIPGRQLEDYAASLMELYGAGLIMLESDFPEDDISSQPGVSKIVERFVRLPKGERQVRYVRPGRRTDDDRQPRQHVRFQLTATGGQEWERLAEPDWSHYFDQRGDQGGCEIVSQNRDLLMAVLGWFQELGGGRVDVNSIQIQKLDNYPILYWKHLPFVFKANFAFDKADPRWIGDGPAWSREPKWFHEWRVATASWYRKPWEMSAWPSK
jgi:hypothetical protein